MKYILIISLIILSSCSQKSTTKSGFKLVLGNSALTASSGGAFINAVNSSTKAETVYELDSENSATISQGSYTLMAVIFAGPEYKSGELKCGTASGVNLNGPEATVTINLTVAECTQPQYTNFILKLKQGTVAKWDMDQWNRSHWGQ